MTQKTLKFREEKMLVDSINLPCLKEIVEEVKKLSKDNKKPLCAKK